MMTGPAMFYCRCGPGAQSSKPLQGCLAGTGRHVCCTSLASESLAVTMLGQHMKHSLLCDSAKQQGNASILRTYACCSCVSSVLVLAACRPMDACCIYSPSCAQCCPCIDAVGFASLFFATGIFFPTCCTPAKLMCCWGCMVTACTWASSWPSTAA